MREELRIGCRPERISEAIGFLQKTLDRKKIRSKDKTRALLTAEETLRAMISRAAGPEEEIVIRVDSAFGNVRIRMSCRGTAFEKTDVEKPLCIHDDEEANAAIEKMVSRILGNTLTVRNRGGVNLAVIHVAASRYRQLYLTVGALFAGLLIGLLMRNTLPESVNTALSGNLFAPVYTMFLNALKLIVAPLVFLSISTSIADFRDIRSLGRIAGKVVGGYFITSFIAILVGCAFWFLFPIGDPALQAVVSDTAAASTVSTAQTVSVSLLDTIVNIIPGDIVKPFMQADMLQIIFIAVLLGLAAGALSDKLHVFRDFLDDCYMVFSRMTAMIISVMPVAVFCSIAKMALSMDLGSMASTLTWIPVIYAADFVMLGVYGLLIFLFGRQNPLTFYWKFFPVMLTGFTFASSNATLPTSLETCTGKLGISRRICSFSLPLGATINMDGSCITMMITALFMAKVFALPVTWQMIATLFLSIFVLSVGAPGVPGAALVCISILLPQIGVPAEAISIIMGLYAIIGMIMVCVNITGDAAITLIVARSEKMLDQEIFNSKEK